MTQSKGESLNKEQADMIEKIKNDVINILKEHSTFVDGQIKGLIVHGAIEKIAEYVIAGRTVGIDEAKKNAIGFAHWKDRHFKRTYPATGYFYCLENYESIKLIPGVKYGGHYSFEELYELYIESQK